MNIFSSKIPADERDLILDLYSKGITCMDIAQSLYRARTLLKVTTTPARCLLDVDAVIRDGYKRKAV